MTTKGLKDFTFKKYYRVIVFTNLSKTIRQTKKVSQVTGAGRNSKSPLHSEMTKTFFFDEKKDSKKCKYNETMLCF